jgi:hypothetical protein
MTVGSSTTAWTCALELDESRRIVAGSPAQLVAALARGADLRVYTEFRHNEHIDVQSSSSEMIQEVSQFGVTCVVDQRWAAGFMSLRQPVNLPDAFGPMPSLSLFLYNQDGRQAIARPSLDHRQHARPANAFAFPGMRKMHCESVVDADSPAPAMNFIYDFNVFRFQVQDRWSMLLRHDADGNVREGDIGGLVDAFAAGAHVKVGITGLCDDLAEPGAAPLPHEVFVECHSSYYYTQQRQLITASQPLPRCRAAIPMRYEAGGWDYGWLVLRTDGHAVYRRCDPSTLSFTDRVLRLGLRWFVS